MIGVLSPASGYLLGVIDLVKEKDPAARRVAILHSSTGTFSPAVALGAESHAVQEGFQTVFTGQYRSPAVDFSSLLDEMEARHPDVILGVGRIQTTCSSPGRWFKEDEGKGYCPGCSRDRAVQRSPWKWGRRLPWAQPVGARDGR